MSNHTAGHNVAQREGTALLRSPVLEAFEVERAQLRARLAALDKAEAVVAEAYPDEGKTPFSTEPRVPSRGQRRSTQAGRFEPTRPTQDEIVRWVSAEDGPVTRREVVDALGGSVDNVGRKLQTLHKKGRLKGHGQGGARAYSAVPALRAAPRAPSEPAASRPTRQNTEAGKRAPQQRPTVAVDEYLASRAASQRVIPLKQAEPVGDRLFDAIRAHGPITVLQLQQLMPSKSLAQIVNEGRSLVARGLIMSDGDGAGRIYCVTAPPAEGAA
jgi:hypothetical protein